MVHSKRTSTRSHYLLIQPLDTGYNRSNIYMSIGKRLCDMLPMNFSAAIAVALTILQRVREKAGHTSRMIYRSSMHDPVYCVRCALIKIYTYRHTHIVYIRNFSKRLFSKYNNYIQQPEKIQNKKYC